MNKITKIRIKYNYCCWFIFVKAKMHRPKTSRAESLNGAKVKRGTTLIKTTKPRVHPSSAAGDQNPVTFTETTRIIRPSSSVDIPARNGESTESGEKSSFTWRRVALLGATAAVFYGLVAMKHSENFPGNVAKLAEGFLGESSKMVKIVKRRIESKLAQIWSFSMFFAMYRDLCKIVKLCLKF